MIKRMMDGGMVSIAARAGLGVGLLLVTGQAAAQQVIQQGPPQTYPAQAYPGQVPQQPVYAQPQQPVYAQPQAAPQQTVMVQAAPTAGAAPAGTDDQKMWVGHIGIGWLGTVPIPFGAGGNADSITAPIVGFRYWVGPTLGLDVGLGFYSRGGSVTGASGTSADTPTTTAFALHAGLPLVLGSSQHLTVELVPELNVGFANRTSKAGDGTDITDSGLHVNVGARAGAELFFGFIGIPALALEGSVGLFLSSLSQKSDLGGGISTKASQLVISTSSVQQPWDIFRSDVAARYYF